MYLKAVDVSNDFLKYNEDVRKVPFYVKKLNYFINKVKEKDPGFTPPAPPKGTGCVAFLLIGIGTSLFYLIHN